MEQEAYYAPHEFANSTSSTQASLMGALIEP
jgi:hypothetical protein